MGHHDDDSAVGTAHPVVDPIGPEQAPLLLRHWFDRGEVDPITGTLAQVPELCQAALPFIGAALGPSSVSARHKEMAILRTSALLGCRYCTETHTVAALDAGLGTDEVGVLRCELDTGDRFVTAAERALLTWIDEVAAGRGEVDPAVTAAMTEHWPQHQIIELTVTIGTTMMLNRYATSLGLPTSPETMRRLADAGFATPAARPS